MGKIGKETAGQIISFIGLVGVAVTTGIPLWRVTSFIGANIVTGQIIWDGLWMNCVMQSTGQMQCRLNESVMRLTPDLQAARALVIISLVFGFIGFMITFIGAKCTSCLQKERSKATVVIIGGCLLILAAVLVLVPVTWSATITITDFQNPLTINTQRREIGAAIYIGWGSTAILLIGGIILTTSCPPKQPIYGYPGYQPAPIYPYSNGSTYAPVYAPTSSQPYTGSGSYAPTKPYRAPTTYPARHVSGRLFFSSKLFVVLVKNLVRQVDRTQTFRRLHSTLHSTCFQVFFFCLEIKQEVIMVSLGRQMLGFILAVIGFLGTIIVCALPMWKVTAFIGANIVTAQVIWEGLWMNCVTQSTGQMQCKIYDSLLALPEDLQAARALVVVAIIVAAVGILLGIAGGKCTNFVRDTTAKSKVAIAAGVVFICAGVLVLIPVSWSANTIIRDFYNPILTNAQRRELGAALYIGWGTAALLILGGALLCSSCPPKDSPEYPVKYSGARSTTTSRAYV
ncbi:uncharacterized protein LOC133537422 [Nerophis ophidion]|uniref:uncharacterized protein LOC133537422 n=1 Tax=Nerophis ophidion TaxID=159077 RepID=UPI002ADF6105|nr:uncharacterized protein LOC133537422 [Nerophis ophidion]